MVYSVLPDLFLSIVSRLSERSTVSILPFLFSLSFSLSLFRSFVRSLARPLVYVGGGGESYAIVNFSIRLALSLIHI